ncbi:MAG TPA: HAMP domain-containing sensor histidine kinase, partial [Longimicrobiales bacterium]|nr:HAMP domain-containing sensor histidine kinase [Longimicrobiales bacterium]
EWETFARGLPIGASMDVVALRDHAAQMLETFAADLDTPQTAKEHKDKSQGLTDSTADDTPTAAQAHGAGRADSGFTIDQMVAEFRALRAVVIRLWAAQCQTASFEDLDEMTRFNEAVDQAIAESVLRYTTDVDRAKERFLAILGHDLATPLSAIATAAAFMLDTGDLEEPHLTLVTRMAGSARRTTRMVADLLDYTRTRFGDAIPIIRDSMDMRKLVHDVVSEIASSYPKSAIQTETSGDLHGDWDVERMTQVLSNMVSNAVHHGSADTPIKIVARGGKSDVTVSVHNDGIAIDPRRMSTLFTAMKGSNRKTDNKNHLGLGLYIVDKIVRAHNGTVEVTSSKAEGTTFTMRVPR